MARNARKPRRRTRRKRRSRKRKQHSVLFSVPERPLKYADLIVVVRHMGEKIGELRISQGGLDWRPGKAKNTRKLNWERFIRLVAEC